MGKPRQIVEMSESILRFYKRETDTGNNSKEFKELNLQKFKDELTKALNCGVATKEIKWVK